MHKLNVGCIIAAQREVRRAVKNGILPNLKTQTILCVDCKTNRATQLDHRNYGKPLRVTPVCQRCNQKRGPGICTARRHTRTLKQQLRLNGQIVKKIAKRHKKISRKIMIIKELQAPAT
jgi:hypothetical protein